MVCSLFLFPFPLCFFIMEWNESMKKAKGKEEKSTKNPTFHSISKVLQPLCEMNGLFCSFLIGFVCNGPKWNKGSTKQANKKEQTNHKNSKGRFWKWFCSLFLFLFFVPFQWSETQARKERREKREISTKQTIHFISIPFFFLLPLFHSIAMKRNGSANGMEQRARRREGNGVFFVELKWNEQSTHSTHHFFLLYICLCSFPF